MEPTHVVVDTRDGYVFWRDGSGELLTADSAAKLADKRNDYAVGTHVVRRLVPPNPPL